MRETAEKKTDEIRMLNEAPGRFNASPAVTFMVRIRKERPWALGYGVCAHFSRLVSFLVTGYLPSRSAAGRWLWSSDCRTYGPPAWKALAGDRGFSAPVPFGGLGASVAWTVSFRSQLAVAVTPPTSPAGCVSLRRLGSTGYEQDSRPTRLETRTKESSKPASRRVSS